MSGISITPQELMAKYGNLTLQNDLLTDQNIKLHNRVKELEKQVEELKSGKKKKKKKG